MNNRLKTLLAAASASLILIPSVQADISWSANPPAGFGFSLWDQGGVGTGNLLDGDPDSAVGFFVQLMDAGPDATIDPAIVGGTGAGDDDIVFGTTWVGQGLGGAFEGAFLAVNSSFPATEEHNFYLRVWNAPSPNFGLGLAPTGPGTFYGDSNLLNVLIDDGINPPGPDPVVVDFTRLDQGGGQGAGNGIATNVELIAVPEPTTLAMLLSGLAAVWLRRRKMA